MGWNNRWLQIDKKHANLQLPRKQVMICQRSDETLAIDHQDKRLTATELGYKPEPTNKIRTVINNRRWKPLESYPWKSITGASGGQVCSSRPSHGGREEQTHKRLAG